MGSGSSIGVSVIRGVQSPQIRVGIVALDYCYVGIHLILGGYTN